MTTVESTAVHIYIDKVVGYMDYTNNDIVACLRQYEMFANSLDMITNPKDRDNIYHQLDRLEEKLIKLTNELYEEEYVTLLNRKT